MNGINAANEAGVELTDDERREVFTSHFLSEQQHIVGPTIETAVAEFDWPLLRTLALCPAYNYRPLLLFRWPVGDFVGGFVKQAVDSASEMIR